MTNGNLSQDQILEYACKKTYERHKNAGIDDTIALDNIEYAIATAIANRDFSSFTRNDNARDLAKTLDADDMTYSLLTNAIYLSDLRHRNLIESLGNFESEITVVSSYLQQNQIDELKMVLLNGCSMVSKEMETISQIKDRALKEKKQLEMAQERRNKSPQLQRCYELTKSLIVSYVYYDLRYDIVNTNSEVENQYDQMLLNNLNKSSLSKNKPIGVQR